VRQKNCKNKKGKAPAVRTAVGDEMEEKRVNNVPATKRAVKKVPVTAKKAVVAKKMAAHPTARRSASEVTNFKIITEKEKVKKPFPWTTVLAAICFTVLFLFMMMNYTALDELKDDVIRQDKQIAELSDKRDKLEDKVAKRDNLDEITKYAENELGMVKKEEVEGQYYIDLNTDDEVNITEYEDENENGLGVLLTGVGNVIKDFFGD